LSDIGELGRAEQVVRRALDRVGDDSDPYMRVRLYWSIARLAHTEGRESVALANVRKAIALLQATDDTLHLARAHILAAGITLSREDADDAERHVDVAERLLRISPTAQDEFEIKQHRSRIALLRGQAEAAIGFAREALGLVEGGPPADQGIAFYALADGLCLAGEVPAADEAYRRALDLLEAEGRWRVGAGAARAWARMLRQNGREAQALDVLERAAELGMRATPAEAHADR
jgi:tetratricopeptide (TPR) repeat protein